MALESRMNRRQLLGGVSTMLAAAASLTREARAQAAPPSPKSPNEKLNIGVIGVAHRGSDNLSEVQNQNIVALCDVDDTYLAQAAQRFPKAYSCNDYRRMLERRDIDAIVISTPDHTHAPATLAALETGRHVYCEKPLTHTVAEARQVTEAARKHKRVTQMGTQIHAGGNYRRVVELVQGGAIGEVREVHCWVGRVWGGNGARPVETPPVPPHLHWDLWLGPVPKRPYHPAYVPINWRGWWAFGGGILGDMGCHHMDLPYWALGLGHPQTVAAEGPPPQDETTPAWLIVRYAYPARGKKPPVQLTWYNGDKRPPHFAEGTLPAWGDGTLFVGAKGMLLADYGRYVLLPEKDFAGFQPPKPSIPDSVGHHAEWIAACKGVGTTTCRFDYSGVLTEAVLLGNVAYRTGKKLEWDAKALKAKHCPEADRFIRGL